MITLLGCLQLEKDQLVVCEFAPAGVKFMVGKDKALSAKAYLKSSCFQEYVLLDRRKVDLCINLDMLLHCLQVFGQSAHMQMRFDAPGDALCLMLEDAGVITQCEVSTLAVPPPVDFEFRTCPIVARAVVKSSFLRDCMAELDVAGGEQIAIHFTQKAPFLSMQAKGAGSSVQIDFPSDNSTDVFTEFQCKHNSLRSYSLSLIRPCIKALAKADHTNLRINQQGMLSMQHVIPDK